MFKILFIVAGMLAAVSAQAILPIPQNSNRFKQVLPFGEFNFALDLRYQIGAEWGKKPVTAETLKD